MEKLRAFVINLERRQDRYKYVMDNYVNNNYNLEIIKAYDGTHEENNSANYIEMKNEFLSALEKNKLNVKNYKYHFLNKFTPGELGCFLSHLLIWKKMIDENIDRALIFEDDCILSNDFAEDFPFIIKELPSDAGICYFGGKMVKDYVNGQNIKLSKYISLKKEQNPYGAFCYLLTLPYVRILYNSVFSEFKGNLGLDYFIDEVLVKNNYPVHLVSPFKCHSVSYSNEGIFKTDIR
jgi:glycosyl transferase family 25